MGSNKLKAIYTFLMTLAIVIVLNVLGSFVYTTFDLTEDKRFSITDPTKKLLNNLKEDVVVKIYLAGELPAGVKRLQKSTVELLDGFKSYSSRIDYEIENPLGGTPEEDNAA